MTIEAEKSVIGAVLLDNAAYYEAEIEPEVFSADRHQHLWSVIRGLADNDMPVDLVSVTSEAREQGTLERCGGSVYISELLEATPTAANVGYYVKTVRNAYAKRKVSELGKRLQTCLDMDEALGMIEETLHGFAERETGESLSSLAKKSVKVYEDRMTRGGELAGLSWGYSWLDSMTGGITPGQLIVLAGRPSMGKTAFALNVCSRSKAKVYFASLETSKQSITDRLFAQQSKVDLRKFRTGRFDRKDSLDIVDTAARMQNSGIYIDDTPAMSLVQLKQRTRRHKIKYGLDFIVVDYLQLMSAKAESRFQEVSQISRGLKQLAKEVAPVIALSQLSRDGDGGPPSMKHLRESGQIEQDADVILFPYREAAECKPCKEYSRDCGKNHFHKAQLDLAKQKDGPTGIVDLLWTGSFQSFEQLRRE